MLNIPMRILLVLPFFHPHPGGSQIYAEELFVHLKKAHPEVSIDILCYNTDKIATFEEYRGLKIHRIPCFNILPGKFVLPYPIALIKKLFQLSKNKYDFVNTHIRFFDTCWWVWVYAKIIGAKSIFTGHCASHPNHENSLVRFVAKLVDLTIAKFSLRFYDIVTVVSDCTGNFFRETLGVKKSYLVYGSVDTKFFQPKQKLRKRNLPKMNLELVPNDILITYVGRLISTKGVSVLYEVAKETLKKYPRNLYFVIAGPGELNKELKGRTAKDKLTKRILLPGALDHKETCELLAISDIFVYPSFHSDGLPLAILEAGASGCFVIVTDSGGTKEIVKHEETGLLVPPKDKKVLKNAIVWAIENPNERKRISQNMRKLLIEKFDWKRQSEEFFQLLERLY